MFETDPTLPRYGTDLLQVWTWFFEAKPESRCFASRVESHYWRRSVP